MPKKGALELTWVGKDQALIPSAEGRYGYDWVDPSDPRVTEVRQIMPLRTVGERRGPQGAVENLLITGDSADVLRSLTTVPELKDRYLGNVKLCYIDPPFNTGGAFNAYDDALEHSIWLTMMRDRLRLIKRLLTDDGSIWVHLDDSENHRMRLLLDEEFGASNFVAEVIWHRRNGRSNDAVISNSHDTIAVYSKSSAFKSVRNRIVISETQAGYRNPDDDPRGPWTQTDFTASGPRTNLGYAITAPDGQVVYPPEGRHWRTTEESYLRLVAEGRIHYRATGMPRQKSYLTESTGLVPTTVWPVDEVGSTDSASRESVSMFGRTRFDTPKPEALLERIIHIATNPGDIVLDCFAGSGTTAAVAHKMRRRWVTCELLQANVDRYTLPRLVKVVDGEDTGGVSMATRREAADGVELPGGLSPAEAQQFTSMLGKVAKHVEGLDAATLKALRVATRTRDVTETRWEGGGGFTVAELAPSMYEVVDGAVYLTAAATNGAFAAHVAGQLGFRYEDAAPFCGRRGRRRLAVVDGFLAGGDVDTIAAALGESESVRIVAKGYDESAAEAVSRAPRGSTIERAPDYLQARRKARR